MSVLLSFKGSLKLLNEMSSDLSGFKRILASQKFEQCLIIVWQSLTDCSIFFPLGLCLAFGGYIYIYIVLGLKKQLSLIFYSFCDSKQRWKVMGERCNNTAWVANILLYWLLVAETEYVYKVSFLYNKYFLDLGDIRVLVSHKPLHHKHNILHRENCGFRQTHFSPEKLFYWIIVFCQNIVW